MNFYTRNKNRLIHVLKCDIFFTELWKELEEMSETLLKLQMAYKDIVYPYQLSKKQASLKEFPVWKAFEAACDKDIKVRHANFEFAMYCMFRAK